MTHRFLDTCLLVFTYQHPNQQKLSSTKLKKSISLIPIIKGIDSVPEMSTWLDEEYNQFFDPRIQTSVLFKLKEYLLPNKLVEGIFVNIYLIPNSYAYHQTSLFCYLIYVFQLNPFCYYRILTWRRLKNIAFSILFLFFLFFWWGLPVHNMKHFSRLCW